MSNRGNSRAVEVTSYKTTQPNKVTVTTETKYIQKTTYTVDGPAARAMIKNQYPSIKGSGGGNGGRGGGRRW